MTETLFGGPTLPPAYPERAAWGTAPKLRAWQQEALDSYFSNHPRDFLAVATPGAGKTTFALRVASELLASGVVQAVTVVAPTEHLRTQWALAAARVGVALDPGSQNALGSTSADHHGVAVREAFEPATRRLCLTGTPFRSDSSPIPFVRYERGPGGITRTASDSSYGCADALRDGVARPVLFLACSGTSTRRTRVGEEITATLGEPLTAEQNASAWKTALDPHSDWMPAVLQAADRRLAQKRADGMPDAGGRAVRRPGGVQEDRAVRRVGRPLAGRRADDLRGRLVTSGKRNAATAAATRLPSNVTRLR